MTKQALHATELLMSLGWSYEGAAFLAARSRSSDIKHFLDRLRKQIDTPAPARRAKRKIPHTLRIEIFSRDEYTCCYCGTNEDLTVDHIIPEIAGGTLDKSNLQTLCRSCNSRKGAR